MQPTPHNLPKTVQEAGQLADAFVQELPPFVPPSQPVERPFASWIDHTLLKPEAKPEQVLKLAAEAREHGFFSVCVNPLYVDVAVKALQGSPVAVCAVTGFPLGATPSQVKVYETQACLDAGAREIDMVIPVGLLKAGQAEAAYEDILAVVETAHKGGALVKVILEMALLEQHEKILGCLLTQLAGAEFVKTSTGFGPGGATTADVELMRRVVGPEMGVKAAGGIRTLADARAMLAAGATRLGCSAGVIIMQELAAEKRAP